MSKLINRLNKTVSKNNETLETDDIVKTQQDHVENHVEDIGEDIGEDTEIVEDDTDDIESEGDDVEDDSEENNDVEDDSEETEENNDIVYIIKVNGNSKCYCSTSDEVNSIIEYIISQLKYKLYSEGWNNIECVKRNDKILWKVIDSNRIVAQLTGNRNNSLIFYENILAEIEVEIVKGYKENKETLIL